MPLWVLSRYSGFPQTCMLGSLLPQDIDAHIDTVAYCSPHSVLAFLDFLTCICVDVCVFYYCMASSIYSGPSEFGITLCKEHYIGLSPLLRLSGGNNKNSGNTGKMVLGVLACCFSVLKCLCIVFIVVSLLALKAHSHP